MAKSPATVDPAIALRLIPGLRWRMIGLVCLATTINYIDRQSISLLFPVLSRPDELGLNSLQYSRIATSLLFAYMLSQSISGRFYDRFGSRIGFTVSIVIWSLAAMAHSLIVGFYSFAILAAVLGFGEAGNWPGAAKVVAEWFPVRERALGTAIFSSGIALGSVIAPPLIVWLQFQIGWRATFLCAGALGFPWLIAWLAMYRTPETHPNVTAEELALIREGRGAAAGPGKKPAPSLRKLLRYRQVWAIVLGRFIVDPTFWFVVLWMPDYLTKAHGFSLKQIGLSAWVPYVAAAAGSLSGGWLVGRLIGSGMDVSRARKIVIVLGGCLTPAGVLAAYADSPYVAIAYISVVLFGFQMWVGQVLTLPSDFFPNEAVGVVAGLGGSAAAIGSMAFTLLTGWLVTYFSYTPVLTIAGLLAPIGTIVVFLLAGRIRRVALDSA